LQGISDEIVPQLYDKSLVDRIIPITDDDAIAMSQKLCKQLSLGVGISSGANFLGAVLTKKKAVTVFADDNKKYLSTDLTSNVNSPLVDKIELLDFKVL
ncbi:MAG: cysteine synthase, partial [Clostridia bacterium]|nr:cysteine synthase [Clostridia bacterium]